MSHIAEGLLHAHLDGAVASDDPAWMSAEAHLAGCGDCRRRLDEARSLRATAGELLAGTETDYGPPPAFGDLLAEAETRRRRKPGVPVGRAWWRSPAKLGWAASLALALGAGWMGRALLVPAEGPPVMAESRPEVDEIGAAGPTLADDAVGRQAESAQAAAENELRRDVAEPNAPARRAAAPADADLVTEQEQARAGPPAEAASRERLEAAAPAVEGQVFAAKAVEAARCYTGEVAGRPAELRLAPDGTAKLRREGDVFVGFWQPRDAGEALRLSDGGAWRELTLRSAGDVLRGELGPGTPGDAAAFSPEACPVD